MTGSIDRPVRVALDLLGGDHAPGAIVSAVRTLASRRPDIEIVLVGPADLAAEHLGDVVGLRLVEAHDVVSMAEDPGRAVRRKPHSSIRVAVDLVAAGAADAVVSAGSTGATIAAAHLVLGRDLSLGRSVLAAVLPGLAGPVVVLDVGGSLTCTADVLGELAVHGAAYASVRLGLTRPRVGLLSIGVEPGKGDELRREAFEAVGRALDGREALWCGNVEGSDVPLGAVDVVVTDGFTGNVLLKALEGALSLFRGTVELAAPAASDAITAAIAPLDPEHQGGALLLGVPGVVVVGHGASRAPAIVSCVEMAADAVRNDWVPRVRALAALHGSEDLPELAVPARDLPERDLPAAAPVPATVTYG